MRRVSAWAFLVMAAVGCAGEEFSEGAGGGGGAAPSGPCNEDPWTCPTGQVCWIDETQSYACLNIGQGQLGQACTSQVGTPGCGELLVCFQEVAGQPGVCTPYCDQADPQKACPNNGPCVGASFENVPGSITICDL